MPKVIENLQQTMLEKAKAILLTEGYDALTIRRVAKECGIAVGTVYNYFTAKDEMAAYVMLEDWQQMLADVSKKIQVIKTSASKSKATLPQAAEKALTCIYSGIVKFNKTYHFIWEGYQIKGSDKTAFASRHQKLIEQIASCVQQVFVLFPPVNKVNQADVFLAENILICSGNSSLQFSSVLKIVMTVLYKK